MQVNRQWGVTLLVNHYPNYKRNMLFSTIAVVELKHTREIDAVAATHILK